MSSPSPSPLPASLAGRRALVTGASAGIGRAIAARLVAAGARVAITARREGPLHAAAAEIGATAIVADAGREEDVVRSVREATAALGGLDILVNNAGFGYHAPLEALDAARFADVWATNVLGAALYAREAARIFRAQRRGDLVSIASTSGTRGYETGTPYVATKFALRGMSECWHAELRRSNVRVTCVCPSEVQTDFGGRHRAGIDPKKLIAEDIADTVVAILALPDRVLLPEFKVIATNPFPEA